MFERNDVGLLIESREVRSTEEGADETKGGSIHMLSVNLQVAGMSCQHCVRSIEGALKEIGAVGRVDLSSGTVDVSYDDQRVTIERIKETIEEQGYEVK